jgi:virulence factor Mce-like protein
MIGRRLRYRLFAVGACVVLTSTSCGFQGMNSFPLPGTKGYGAGATVYHVQIANISALEPNSPVMIGDVVVGAVGPMTVKDWHAEVEISVEPGVVVPANVVAAVGQTSLLGSMHLELDAPLGEAPTGKLPPGATIPLNRASSYPSTEQTLSSLSLVVNNGGLGQISDVIHNFSVALSGRQGDVRDLLTRLDTFVGTMEGQRDNMIAAITALDRLSETFAGRRDVITRALRDIPPALDVLVREQPQLTTALDKLGEFGELATGIVNDTQADLVKNLQNLEPTVRALADVGPDLDTALAFATTFPFTQNVIDRAVRGDYFNLFAVVDLTLNRLKRSLFLGTRWADENAKLVPAPGDPGYDLFPTRSYYTKDPLMVGIGIPPPGTPLPVVGTPPAEALAPAQAPPPGEAPPPPIEAGVPTDLPPTPGVDGGP